MPPIERKNTPAILTNAHQSSSQ